MKTPIEHFCEEKYPTPFKHGLHVYATDGKIALCELKKAGKTTWPKRDHPNMAKLFKTSFVDFAWKPLPKPPIELLHVCNCAVDPVLCPHCGKEIRCETCFGTRKTGSRETRFDLSEDTGISLYYAHALTTLFPGIEFCLDLPDRFVPPPVSLRWPGGIGLLMPLRPATIKPH